MNSFVFHAANFFKASGNGIQLDSDRLPPPTVLMLNFLRKIGIHVMWLEKGECFKSLSDNCG